MKCCWSDSNEEKAAAAQPAPASEPTQQAVTAASEVAAEGPSPLETKPVTAPEAAEAATEAATVHAPAPPVEAAPISENVQDGAMPEAKEKVAEAAVKDVSAERELKPAAAPMPVNPQPLPPQPPQSAYYYAPAPYPQSPYHQPAYAYPYAQPGHVKPPPGTVTRHVEPYVGPLTLTVACLPGILCCFWCSLVFLCCPIDFTVVETRTVAASPGTSNATQAPQQQTYVYM